MRKLILFTLAALAVVCSGNIASAQTRQLHGQIPFDFTAGAARLSAGEYRITYDPSGAVTFRNLVNGYSAMMFVGANEGIKGGTCELIFNRYGAQYFLKQSSCSAADASFFVPISKFEKKALERASSNRNGETTVVAMK